MSQKIIEQILTPIRSLIMKSRPAYKDYLGEETVEEKKLLVSGEFGDKIKTKASFVEGETYLVSLDGVEQEMVAQDLSFGSQRKTMGFTDLDLATSFYFGYVSETGTLLFFACSNHDGKTIALYHGDTLIADATLVTDGYTCKGDSTIHDETFEGFVEGETYSFVFDGGDPMPGFYDGSSSLLSYETSWVIGADLKTITVFGDTSTDLTTFSVSQKVTTTKKLYDTKLLPEDLLPKSVVKQEELRAIKSQIQAHEEDLNVLQSDFSSQQSTISSTKIIAEDADVNAKKAIKSLTFNKITYTYNGEWATSDSHPSLYYNLDSFGRFDKIADFPDGYIMFESGKTTTVSNNYSNSVFEGDNAMRVGGAILVKSAGQCSIEEGNTTFRFTASAPGIYVEWRNLSDNEDHQVKEFVLSYYTLHDAVLNGDSSVVLRSSTLNSEKRFKITVDDTGALTATEITE